MKLKQKIATGVVGLGIAAAGLGASAGAATATIGPSATTGPSTTTPAAALVGQVVVPSAAPTPRNNAESQRLEQARRDHAAFEYHNRQVQPVFDNQYHSWGFWFDGKFVRL